MQLDQIKCPCCGQMTTPTTEVEVDLFNNRIRYGSESIQVKARLAKLASILAEKMPAYMTHEHIATKMWGDAEIDVDGNLKVAVCHLRAKLKPLGLTVSNSWGRGYAMAKVSRSERTTGFSTVTGEDYAQA